MGGVDSRRKSSVAYRLRACERGRVCACERESLSEIGAWAYAEEDRRGHAHHTPFSEIGACAYAGDEDKGE